MFPYLPVQPINECTRTDTLNYDPGLFFDGRCYKTPPRTKLQPSIDRHSLRVKPLPPYINLLSTCALDTYGGEADRRRNRVRS